MRRPDVAVNHEPDLCRGQRGSSAPVVLVALQAERLALDLLDDLERPGAGALNVDLVTLISLRGQDAVFRLAIRYASSTPGCLVVIRIVLSSTASTSDTIFAW